MPTTPKYTQRLVHILVDYLHNFVPMQLFDEIIIRHVNPGLNIGLQDVRNAWLLASQPIKLSTSLHRGNLIYRLPGTGKRISYRQLKKGLIKKQIIIHQPLFTLPF